MKRGKVMMAFHQVPNTFVGQVNLKVENIQRSLTFYQNMIGFQILEQTEKKVIFTANGKTPLLSIEQPENVIPKQPRTTGLYHFAILLPKRSDLAKVLEHLVQNSYPLQGASDHLVSEALYLADPDGNGIEIYIDRPNSSWKWNNGEVAMVSDPLDVQNLLSERDSEPWLGLPTDSLIGHIHLHVSELKQSEEFYGKGLGFDIVNRYGNQALFISTGGYHHHIGLNTWNGTGAPRPSGNSVGLSSYTLIFPSEEARNKTAEQLKGIGATSQEVNGVIVTHDPSGNQVLLMV